HHFPGPRNKSLMNCRHSLEIDRAEDGLEGPPQGGIHVLHARRDSKRGEACDAKARIAHPAGHDAGEMIELRIDVDAYAVKGDPMAKPHPDGGNLVLATVAVTHPDADAIGPPLAHDLEFAQGLDDPLLQIVHEQAHVRLALLEIEHHISDSLSGAVVGVLA